MRRCNYWPGRMTAGHLTVTSVGLRRSSVRCSGRAAGAGRHSIALSTGRRIWWNHQAARERSICRRRQAGRSQAGVPLNPRSSWLRVFSVGESAVVLSMFFITFVLSTAPSSHRGLDEYWVTPSNFPGVYLRLRNTVWHAGCFWLFWAGQKMLPGYHHIFIDLGRGA